MSNPPHLAAKEAPPSPHPERALAHAETTMDLASWLAACLRMLRPEGYLTLIHRADRLDELLAALLGRAGDVVVFPLWPAADGRPGQAGADPGPQGRPRAAAARARPGPA